MSKKNRHLPRHKRAERKFKEILADETVCVIQTPAGNWKVPRGVFAELVTNIWCEPLTKRVARVRPGFGVAITGSGYYAEHSIRPDASPTVRTFSMLVERMAVFNLRGVPPAALPQKRAQALREIERETLADYRIHAVFEPI